jgi:group I intron endonuclease
MFYVYRIYDNNNKSYIGVTEFLEKRIEDHLKGRGSKNIAEALLKGQKFSFEVLETFPNLNEAYEREKFFIEKLDTIKNGYNITKGGFGGFKSDRKGIKNTQSILTEDIVIEIRNKYWVDNLTQENLSKLYGVSRENISAIVRGKSWPHVAGPIGLKKVALKKEITPEIQKQIIELRKLKLTYYKIAKELDITVYYAYKYGKGVI